uniref:Uncharacterized protein n=1 Tax=Timema shepardi TaxID=629360 RepID=A0A7R9AYZ5_TIMSH|nr:unnamed protein product [Timema shepardi]
MKVDIDIQEDIDIDIKSEPDNYTSCSVKLEHLTDGFLTILENIKIDTNTQEDVVKHIKSEMDDFKPCCVKLERISDRFLTTGNHTQLQQNCTNYITHPLAQLTRLIVNTITTLVRRSRTKTELSQEVNRKVTPTKRKRGPLLTHEPVVTGWLANTPSPWWEAFSPALSVTTPSQEVSSSALDVAMTSYVVLSLMLLRADEQIRVNARETIATSKAELLTSCDIVATLKVERTLPTKVDTNTQEYVDIPIKSEMDDFKPCCVKLERISDSFLTTENHTQQKSVLDVPREEINVLNMEGTKQREHVEKQGALLLLGAAVSVLNMEELGLGRLVKKKSVLDVPREEINVLNMEELGKLVTKKFAQIILRGEVNVLNMEELGRPVKKKASLNILFGEVNVWDMVVLGLGKDVIEMGALTRLRVERTRQRDYVEKKGALLLLAGVVSVLNMVKLGLGKDVIKMGALNRFNVEVKRTDGCSIGCRDLVNVLNMEEHGRLVKKKIVLDFPGEEVSSKNGVTQTCKEEACSKMAFEGASPILDPLPLLQASPTLDPVPLLQASPTLDPVSFTPAACVSHSRPVTTKLYELHYSPSSPVDSPNSEHDHHPSSPLAHQTELSQEVNRKVTPTKRLLSLPPLRHIHSHSDDLDRDLSAHRTSPLDVDQGPPRPGTFPRSTVRIIDLPEGYFYFHSKWAFAVRLLPDSELPA